MRPLDYFQAIAWMVLSVLCLLLAAQFLVSVRPNVARDLVTLGIVDAAVFLTFSALLAGLHGGQGERSTVAQFIGARPTDPWAVVLAGMLGVVIQVPADDARRLVEHFVPLTEQEVLERAAALSTESTLQGVMLVLVAACLVPLAEEVFFRGALYSALRRSKKTAFGAAAVTSVGFAICHFDLRLWLPILIVAVALGAIRAVTGSLLPCFALHVAFNALTVVGAVTGFIQPTGDVELSLVARLSGWLLAGAIFYTLWTRSRRNPRAEEARGADVEVL